MGNENCLAVRNAAGYSESKCYEKIFYVDIDWDIDFYTEDGCHGTDWFSRTDDPIRLEFRTNFGEIDVSPIVCYNTYCTQRETWSLDLNSPGQLNAKKIPKFEEKFIIPSQTPWNVGALNKDLYKCLKDGYSYATLTIEQRMIVDVFFDAVKATFPSAYLGE